MQAEVINTGSELLLGLVQNTHLAWMAGQLAPLGVTITRQTCVPDGPDIGAALNEALDRTDIVFCTGGLGPTADDISREAAADLLGLPLLLDEGVLNTIRSIFARRTLQLSDNNRRQAMVPKGAHVLANAYGTAPGLYFPKSLLSNRRAGQIFLLPGPPRELYPMFESAVLPLLRDLLPPEEKRECRIYRLTGMGESQLENRIGFKIEARRDITVGYCARPSEVDFRLIGPSAALDAADPLIQAEVGEWIYSRGESLESAVVALLQEKKLSLSTAESCTGGALADRITNVPGSSRVFLAGLVTYSCAAKQGLLGVSSELLEKHGAVSEAVAAAMAEGARRVTGSTFALSTTGVAGPGDAEGKPAGTVFIALAAEGRATAVLPFLFSADRPTFKQRSVMAALDILRRHLLELPLSSDAGQIARASDAPSCT